MAPAIYQELRDTPGEWLCPSCSEIKQVTTTSYRQDQHSSSGESDDEVNTSFGSKVTDTPNKFNSNNFIMTPAHFVVTPAPSSTLDAANSSFQSVVPLDQWRLRDWDTSLATQETYLPLRPQSYHVSAPLADWDPGLNGLELLDSVESNSPPHDGQNVSFGDFPPQLPTDAVNCSMQLQGNNLLPQSSGIVEEITSNDDSNVETEPVHKQAPVMREQQANLPEISIKPTLEESNTEKVWANIPYNELVKGINSLYEETVFYRKNLFKVPSGKAGKEFIAELTFWLRQFNQASKLNRVAIKIFLMLPTILLQKPSAKSTKAKQHSEALERRLQQWRMGKIDELV
jgi:hypothetical protein